MLQSYLLCQKCWRYIGLSIYNNCYVDKVTLYTNRMSKNTERTDLGTENSIVVLYNQLLDTMEMMHLLVKEAIIMAILIPIRFVLLCK